VGRDGLGRSPASLARLPEEERRAIELAYFEGHTYVQVAEILKVPEARSRAAFEMACVACVATFHAKGFKEPIVMTHDEAAELLAAMALDALDTDAHTNVEEHILTCTECQRELDSLREVASAIGNTYEAPPEGLWSKIATRLYETDPTDVPSPPVFLGDFDPAGPSDHHRTRRARGLLLTVSLAAAAAIIALASLCRTPTLAWRIWKTHSRKWTQRCRECSCHTGTQGCYP